MKIVFLIGLLTFTLRLNAQDFGVYIGGGSAHSALERESGLLDFAEEHKPFNALSAGVFYQQIITPRFRLEAGGYFQYMKWQYHHQQTIIGTSEEKIVDFKSSHRSAAFTLGGVYDLIQMEDGSKLYVQPGFRFSFNKTGSVSASDNYSGFAINTFRKDYNNALTYAFQPEIGLIKPVGDRSSLAISVYYTIGLNELFSGEYTAQFDPASDPFARHTFSSNGNAFMVGLKYIHHSNPNKEPKEKVEKPKKEKKVKDPRPEKVEEDIDVSYTSTGIPEEIDGRDVKKIEDVKVKDEMLTLSVWDHNQVDGDTISLYVNGKCVLKEYALTKEHKTVTVKLVPGQVNFLILYAHNLGTLGKNTVAISIDDGKNESIHKLESDLKQSEAINLKYK